MLYNQLSTALTKELNTLKDKFTTGKIPTQADFSQFITASFNAYALMKGSIPVEHFPVYSPKKNALSCNFNILGLKKLENIAIEKPFDVSDFTAPVNGQDFFVTKFAQELQIYNWNNQIEPVAAITLDTSNQSYCVANINGNTCIYTKEKGNNNVCIYKESDFASGITSEISADKSTRYGYVYDGTHHLAVLSETDKIISLYPITAIEGEKFALPQTAEAVVFALPETDETGTYQTFSIDGSEAYGVLLNLVFENSSAIYRLAPGEKSFELIWSEQFKATETPVCQCLVHHDKFIVRSGNYYYASTGSLPRGAFQPLFSEQAEADNVILPLICLDERFYIVRIKAPTLQIFQLFDTHIQICCETDTETTTEIANSAGFAVLDNKLLLVNGEANVFQLQLG